MAIGGFARATRLSVRALRNYDRSGLLRPAEGGPDTGYRRGGGRGGCRPRGGPPSRGWGLPLPVARRPRAAGRMSAGELPAAQLAATVHTGPYRGIDAAYRALGRWIAEHGRTLAGPAEEVYLVPPGVAAEELRTEVAWPIDAGS